MSEEHGNSLHAERDDHYRGEQPARKSMAKGAVTVFLGVAVIAGGLGGAGYWFYNQGHPVQDEGNLPILLPDPSPIKIRPEDPGGMEVPHRETTVYDQLSDIDPDANVVLQELPDMPRAPEVVPGTVGTLSEPAPEDQTAVSAMAQEDPAGEEPEMASAKPAAEAEDAVSVTAPEISEPELTDAQKAVAAAEAKAVAQEQTAAIVNTETTTAAAPAGNYRVQLASVREETGAAAEWKRLSSKNNDLLGNLQMFVQRKEIEGKGVFYRLQAGPLSDSAGAEKLCADLKQRNVGCLIVRP